MYIGDEREAEAAGARRIESERESPTGRVGNQDEISLAAAHRQVKFSAFLSLEFDNSYDTPVRFPPF